MDSNLNIVFPPVLAPNEIRLPYQDKKIIKMVPYVLVANDVTNFNVIFAPELPSDQVYFLTRIQLVARVNLTPPYNVPFWIEYMPNLDSGEYSQIVPENDPFIYNDATKLGYLTIKDKNVFTRRVKGTGLASGAFGSYHLQGWKCYLGNTETD